MKGNPSRWVGARAGVLAAALLLGCSDVIESPTVASKAVQPDLVCVEQLTKEVVLSGDGFTPMPIKTLDATELQPPHIALDRKQDLAGASASGKAEHHAATFAGGLAAVLRPTLTTVAPDLVCDAQGNPTMTLTGTGFLASATLAPSVTVGSQTFAPKAVTGCAAVPGTLTEGAVTSCTSITFVIPIGTLPEGDSPVVVANPLPADCASIEDVKLRVDTPPVVASVVPASLCASGGSITVNGTGFLPATTVGLEATGLATLTSSSTMVNAPGTQVAATFGGGTTVGSLYDVVVSSDDGRTDAPPHKQVTIVPGPIAFFADPEVVFNRVNTRVTVHATTLTLPLPDTAGRYIHVAGGSDGTTATATYERAMILTPPEVPSMDIDDLTPAATGLDRGTCCRGRSPRTFRNGIKRGSATAT